MTRASWTSLCGLIVVLAPVVGAAQPGVGGPDVVVVEPVPMERRGFMLGASVGRGSISIECDACAKVAPLTEALSYSGHVGWMLAPNAAVMLEHWSIRFNDRGSEWFDDSQQHLVAQRITTVSGQLWFARVAWVRAGLGVGRHISDSRYAKVPVERDNQRSNREGAGSGLTDNGGWSPAATAAIGIEFASTPTFAADVQLRIGTTRRAPDEYQVHNTGIVFGASWF